MTVLTGMNTHESYPSLVAMDGTLSQVPSSKVNEALERLARNDVRYRLVLDPSDLS